MTRRHLSLLILSTLPLPAQNIALPNRAGSLKFAVIGDAGTGKREQYETAQRLIASRERFPFEFVLMLGDNLYGSEKPSDFVNKFERPYKPLIDAGVKFYASLGNHDEAAVQRRYKLFNMDGERFYTFKPRDGVRFFALDSNYMDAGQLQWLERELSRSGSDWKICFLHHPLYASGKHGSNLAIRAVLEPLFVKHGVKVVLAGHEHFYERVKPQNGIHHFVSGGAGKLRRGDIGRRSGLTAKGFDTDYHFMLFEIGGGELHYQAISRTGATIDSGMIRQNESAP